MVLGVIEHVNTIVLGLAGAALVAATTRLAFSLRQQRALNESRQHLAVTDELTGLANRRRLLDELEGLSSPCLMKTHSQTAWPFS